MKRKAPTAPEKIACLLIDNRALRGDPIADWETLKAMTPDHHVTYHEWCGHNHPTVFTPLYILEHRKRTATFDVPTLAKVRRSLKRRQNAEVDRARRKVRGRAFPSKEERRALRAKYGRPA